MFSQIRNAPVVPEETVAIARCVPFGVEKVDGAPLASGPFSAVVRLRYKPALVSKAVDNAPFRLPLGRGVANIPKVSFTS